jgi:hypothetical protein
LVYFCIFCGHLVQTSHWRMLFHATLLKYLAVIWFISPIFSRILSAKIFFFKHNIDPRTLFGATFIFRDPVLGCQIVCFQTKNPNFGKFWRTLDWKMLIYFMVIRDILWSFGIFYGHLGYFMEIWDIVWPFGTFCIHLVHFFQFWYHVPRNIRQPCSRRRE